MISWYEMKRTPSAVCLIFSCIVGNHVPFCLSLSSFTVRRSNAEVSAYRNESVNKYSGDFHQQQYFAFGAVGGACLSGLLSQHRHRNRWTANSEVSPASKYQSGRHRQLVDINRHTSAIPRQADAGF